MPLVLPDALGQDSVGRHASSAPGGTHAAMRQNVEESSPRGAHATTRQRKVSHERHNDFEGAVNETSITTTGVRAKARAALNT